jgi:Tol biopolymer transport system component
MLASGAAQTRLTSSHGFDGEPSWSPDGTQIAFRSDRGGQPGIYVMNDSGRNVQVLSPGLVAERLPAWQPSPDAVVGDQLLFTTGFGAVLRQIALVNANGTGRRTLVVEAERDATMATWSPDGSWLAFASDRDGTYDIFVAPTDGVAAANLTDHPGKDMYPAWSPDGTRITFESFRNGNWDVFVMNSDGSRLINLTNNPASDGNPAWSPDGTRIAFSSDRVGAFDLYVIDVGGVEPLRQVTADPALDAYPAWSPSGEQLAFRSNRRGNLDIYLLDVATGATQLFTPNDANDDQPAWSPDGARIAFVSDRGAAESGGSYDVYLKSVRGGGLVRVTATAEREQFPRWRPR